MFLEIYDILKNLSYGRPYVRMLRKLKAYLGLGKGGKSLVNQSEVF